MRRSRWEWRYAAAGLGWGAAVGMLTGALVGLGSMLDPAVRGEAGGPDGAIMLLALPVYGAVYGVLPGALMGVLAGFATTLTTSGVTDPQRAWRSAFITTWVAGLAAGVALPFAIGAFTYPMAWWSVAVILFPVTLGAWLMARTTGWVLSFTQGQHRCAASPTSATPNS